MGYEKYFFLFEKEPEPTQTQKDIEMAVTNDLGYNTRTQYVERKSNFFKLITSDSKIHDTPKGLEIHLAELDARTNPSKRLNDLIKTYKQLAVDMAELPYMGIADEVKSDFNKKASNF